MKARLVLLWLVLSFLLGACRQEGEMAEAAYGAQDIQALQRRTVEAIWTTLSENYVYQDFNGIDWPGRRDAYLAQLAEPLDEAAFARLLESMVAELPAGSVQLQRREERVAAAAASSQGYQGIGAFVTLRETPEPRLLLMEVMPGSPAENAGLKAHDAILAIDGQPVEAGSAEAQISRVRGEAGSDVLLRVRSPGEAPRQVTVTRGQIGQVGSRLTWYPLGNTHLGYIRFPPLVYEELLQDFVLALQTFDSTGDLEGLVLDLRVASVGETWPVAPLLTLFTAGEVGEIYSREEANPVSVTGVFDFVDSQEVPLAILVGPSTSGPAEIFAAALQEMGEAAVVGMATPGDVETLASFFLPDGTQAYVAVFAFRTKGGREIGLEGLEPDIELDVDWDAVSEEADPVIGVAVELLQAGLAE